MVRATLILAAPAPAPLPPRAVKRRFRTCCARRGLRTRKVVRHSGRSSATPPHKRPAFLSPACARPAPSTSVAAVLATPLRCVNGCGPRLGRAGAACARCAGPGRALCLRLRLRLASSSSPPLRSASSALRATGASASRRPPQLASCRPPPLRGFAPRFACRSAAPPLRGATGPRPPGGCVPARPTALRRGRSGHSDNRNGNRNGNGNGGAVHGRRANLIPRAMQPRGWSGTRQEARRGPRGCPTRAADARALDGTRPNPESPGQGGMR
jgi:hypothetical protein